MTKEERRVHRKLYNANWWKNHPIKVAQYKAEYSQANIAASKSWHAKHPEVRRDFYKRHPELRLIRNAHQSAQRKVKLEQAAGRPKPIKCEVCKNPADKIVFDHCHKSGKFRGWICDACNRALGYAKDSPIVLRKLASYIEANSRR